MRLEDIHTIEDMRALAKRRLPRVVFEYTDGGAGDQQGLDNNARQFRNFRLVPRYLVDVSKRSTKVTVFGREYSTLFGIAPTGYAGLYRPGGEKMLAQAALEGGIPYVQSGSSVASIEEIGEVSRGNSWFQLYAARDPNLSADLLRRAADAGVETAAVTVDLPAQTPRPRDYKAGWKVPPKMTPQVFFDGLRHPAWSWNYLRSGGLPAMGNWKPYAGEGASAADVAMFSRTHAYSPQTWSDIERYRKTWKGNLVLKGILHREDARIAAETGVDGVIVSNHGGRQFERAPAPIEVLPGIVEAAGSRLTVMMDSGISSGVDMLIAYALGAKFVFVGRATAWGLIVGGLAGVKRSIEILRRQADLGMGQIGCNSPAELTKATLLRVE
jgi:L-lactate dehydrogenase (cytochrome)/(S)-mandelate dehydrogenase